MTRGALNPECLDVDPDQILRHWILRFWIWLDMDWIHRPEPSFDRHTAA